MALVLDVRGRAAVLPVMMMSMSRRIILSTNRLTITDWVPGDFGDLAALHSDPLTMRFIGYGRPDTPAEARSRLDGYLHEQRARGWTKWRVENLDGDMVGRAGFGEVESCRELAYALNRDLWGQGLATEIAGALVEWHLEHPARELRRAGCARMSRWGIKQARACSTRFTSSTWTDACTRVSIATSFDFLPGTAVLLS